MRILIHLAALVLICGCTGIEGQQQPPGSNLRATLCGYSKANYSPERIRELMPKPPFIDTNIQYHRLRLSLWDFTVRGDSQDGAKINTVRAADRVLMWSVGVEGNDVGVRIAGIYWNDGEESTVFDAVLYY